MYEYIRATKQVEKSQYNLDEVSLYKMRMTF
jgi:hypothetical protein